MPIDPNGLWQINKNSMEKAEKRPVKHWWPKKELQEEIGKTTRKQEVCYLATVFLEVRVVF